MNSLVLKLLHSWHQSTIPHTYQYLVKFHFEFLPDNFTFSLFLVLLSLIHQLVVPTWCIFLVALFTLVCPMILLPSDSQVQRSSVKSLTLMSSLLLLRLLQWCPIPQLFLPLQMCLDFNCPALHMCHELYWNLGEVSALVLHTYWWHLI